MGQTLSEPITEKTTTHEVNSKYSYGCSHMQGWRLSKFFFYKQQKCCIKEVD
jgi:hypothetical protein